MVGINIDPFFEGVVGNRPMSLPHIITNILASGPNTAAHAIVSLLPISGGPAPTPIIPTVPPFIPGGSVPSMNVSTIPVVGSQLQVPPVMQGLTLLQT